MRPDIDALLEKYWNAETSLEEEMILKSYFISKDVSESHLPYKGLFESFEKQSVIYNPEPNDIHILLEKYWEGETLQHEEVQLKMYFSKTTIDSELEPFRDLFIFWETIENIESNQYGDISATLDKYWEGETSLQEEKLLKAYFNNLNILPQHEAYKDYFLYLGMGQEIAFKDDKDKPIALPNSSQTKVIQIKRWLYAAAAVFVLGLSSWFVFQTMNTNNSSQSLVQEIEDPEEAYRVTMEALAMLSSQYKTSEDLFKENIYLLENVDIFK